MKNKKGTYSHEPVPFPKVFLAIILYCKNDYRVKGSYYF